MSILHPRKFLALVGAFLFSITCFSQSDENCQEKTENEAVIADQFSDERKWDSAAVHYRRAFVLCPNEDENWSPSLLIRHGKALAGLNLFDNSLDTLEPALAFFASIGNKALHAQAQRLNAYNLLGKNDFQGSIQQYKEALDYFKKTGDSVSIASIWVNIGIAYDYQKQQDSATDYLSQAIPMLERFAPRSSKLNQAYHTLGIISLNRRDLIETQKINLKLRAYYGQYGEPEDLIANWISTGNLYEVAQNFSQALNYYDSARIGSSELDDQSLLAFAFQNTGSALWQVGRVDSAMIMFKEAHDLRNELGDKKGILTSSQALASAYLESDTLLEHVPELLEVSEKLADSLDLPYERLNNLLLRAKYYLAIEEYNRALTTVEKYRNIDSTEAQSMYAAYQSQLAKKGIDVVQKLATSARSVADYQQTMIIALITAIFFFVALAVVYFMQNRAKQRIIRELAAKNEEVARKNEEIALLNRDMNHRIANNLERLSQLFYLQMQQLTDDEAAGDALREGHSRIITMGVLHRQLYSRSDSNRIEMELFLTEVINNLCHIFYPETESARVTHRIDLSELPAYLAIPLALITTELCSNAFKHNREMGSRLEVAISLEENESGEGQLIVRDNGKGWAPEAEDSAKRSSPISGRGLVQLLSKQIGGELDWQTTNGVHTTLTFPFKVQIP